MQDAHLLKKTAKETQIYGCVKFNVIKPVT